MSETHEFINKLINKDDSELDKLLSFPENNKKKKNDADKILEEVLNETRTNSAPVKTIKLSVPASQFSKNYHHICRFICEKPDYISYGSICEFSEEDAAPVITDDINKKEAEVIPETENVPVPEESETVPETEGEYSALTGFERFYAEQEKRHSRFFFILGLSISLVVLLGIISCAYLGLNAMKNFADTYKTTL